MSHTTLNTKLHVTLFASALALATFSPAHAQVLGRGSIAGGLGGGAVGGLEASTLQPAMGGRIDSSARGMGMGMGMFDSGLGTRAAERRAERLHQHATSTATDVGRATRSLHGPAGAGETVGLNGTATGNLVGQAHDVPSAGVADTVSSMSDGADASGVRSTLGSATRQTIEGEHSAVSTSKSELEGAPGDLRRKAGDAGARATAAAAGATAVGTDMGARAAQAIDVASAPDVTGTASKPMRPKPHGATVPSNNGTTGNPSRAPQGAATGNDHRTSADLDGSGAAQGHAHTTTASRTSAAAQGHGHADAGGSVRNGGSVHARGAAGANAGASAGVQQE